MMNDQESERPIEGEFKQSLKHTRSFLQIVVAVLFIIYILSGIYSISPNEIGVLQRFGKIVDADVRPGIHYAFPWPVDKINRVAVKEVKSLIIDDLYEQGENANLFYRFTGLSSNSITGDNNIVTMSCVLQFTIANPRDYLFNIVQEENQREITLRSLATNTLIHCLAQTSVDETLTFGKKQIETFVKRRLQDQLDSLKSGINITFVELNNVRPPSIVQHYFDDVINAKIDKRKMISKAESYKNERIPAANGKYNRTVQEAEAYKNKVIDEASGDAQRFLAQLAEYRKNPSITRERLYHEFITRLYPLLENKVIVDGKQINLRLMESNK